MVGVTLINEARAAGLVVLAGDDGRLIVRGPRSGEVIARKLLDNKADVLRALQNTQPVAPAKWPIIPGEHHFSIWVDDADGDWPEFIPGYHYSIRQPSRLQPLCTPRNCL